MVQYSIMAYGELLSAKYFAGNYRDERPDLPVNLRCQAVASKKTSSDGG